MRRIQDVNKLSAGLRIIRTARTVDAINEAAKAGFFPLVKEIERNPKLQQKFGVMQNETTGEIEVAGDYRCQLKKGWKWVIEWTFVYPYSWPEPFAAYLIPPDLEVGETVFLEDVIEDLVGVAWNQGDSYRLENCRAVWNGSDFDLDYDPDVDRTMIVG